MTTNFKILLILIVIYASCGKKTESLSEIILANEKAIISIWPDNEILEELTQELGEEDLYVITDDKLWYESQLINKADSP